MKAMKEKPGVMIYFDMRQVLEQLSLKDAGLLFTAILEYGQTGVVPVLSKRLQLIWAMVQMRLDLDTQRYQNTVMRKRYAAYVRWTKQQELQPDTFEVWHIKYLEDPEGMEAMTKGSPAAS